MPNPKIFCTQARGRVNALVKQYASIKDKPRPTDIDDSQPPKSEMRRLKLLAELVHADYDIIRVLSDKIASVTAEWDQAVGDIDDETAHAAANLGYENCRVETGWEDIMSIHSGHLTLLLDSAHHAAERHAEALAAKDAEAESSSHTNGHGKANQSRQGNGSANSAHQSHAHSGGTFGSPTAHFGQKHSDERVFEEDEAEDETRATLATAIATAMAAIHLELPPCPAFDGNITEYNTFRDRFINVVEASGRRLTDRDKMATLLQLLKGKPARMCTGFPISDANYWRVLDMLADEYDHQEELEQILLQQLRSLPAPRDSRHDLNEFYIDASRLLRQLEDMGSDYNTRDVLQALQSKLPQHVLSCILRGKKAGCTWNTAALMNRLHTEVQHARELRRILQPDALASSGEPPARPRIECIESTLGTAAFATWNHSANSAAGPNARQTRPVISPGNSAACAFCDANTHPSTRCTRYSTREARLTRALYRGICPKCCSNQPQPHFGADCPHADQGCFHCKRSGHNQAFCIKYLAGFDDRVEDPKVTSDEALAQTDENYWKTDNIGITLPEPGPEDELVFQRHRDRITRDEEGRHVTPIPWRTPDGTPVGNDVLRQNYGLALGRLDTILKNQSPEVLKKIDESFKGQEALHVIDKVDPRERNAFTKHYLASQVVIKESSNTTKLRIVYDASAGSGRNTKSLNDCTHRGPVLIPSLPGMLIRARTSAIVLTTDLEKAYLQLALPPEDRDLAAEIKCNCYVDNIILAADSVAEALEKYRQTKAIFADAKVNAREFASNSKELLAQLPKEDVSESTVLFHSLGVNWDFTDD